MSRPVCARPGCGETCKRPGSVYCSRACRTEHGRGGPVADVRPVCPYVASPSNNLRHRRIRDEQLRIIRAYLQNLKGERMKSTAVRVALALLMVLGLSCLSSAQAPSLTEACLPGTPPYIVTSAKPFTVTWVQAATVPVSPTDPTLVPERINGFTYVLDSGAAVDFVPTSGPACVGGTNAGKIPYLYAMPSGVPKGSHTLSVTAWNYVLNPDGTNSSSRQSGAATAIPFDAIDPVKLGPPGAPANGRIYR